MLLKSKLKGAPCDLQHILIFSQIFNIFGFIGITRLSAKFEMAAL
jgi:hypothetical protein